MNKEILMKKQTIKGFDMKYFLLGVKKEDGRKIWLKEIIRTSTGWIGGVITTCYDDNPEFGIDKMIKFDAIIPEEDFYDRINDSLNCTHVEIGKKYLKETTLSEEEWRQLIELIRQFYLLSGASEIFQTSKNFIILDKEETSKEIAQKIDKEIQEIIIPEIEKIFND